MNNKFIKYLLKLKNKVMSKVLGSDRSEERSIEEIKTIINSLSEPETMIERSYNQYVCQKNRYENFLYKNMFMVLNILLFIPLIVILIFMRSKHSKIENIGNKKIACLQGESVKDRIPNSIKIHEEIIFNANNGLELSKKDKKFILKIWKKFPFSVLFVTKCALKIALYSGIINSNNIKAILTTSEDSYTSSVLTEYCRLNKIEHINVMHGEIIFGLARTFFEFDKCYVWDEYYIDLCENRLRAGKGQFILEKPDCLIYKGDYINKNIIKYYLQGHTKEQMKVVKNNLDSLNMEYKVRPHPRYGDFREIREVFDESRIEDFNTVSIEKSIMESEILIAWDSTTLYQGYVNGKKIILDDLSNIERYNHLEKSKHMLCSKSNIGRLSTLKGEINER